MDVIPFSIKIKQTNQTESLKVKGNSRTIPPTLTSFNQIFHNLHKSPSATEQKNSENLQNTTNQENNIKNIESVKLKLSAVIASLTTRIQETQKQQDPNLGILPTDQDSHFQLTDASISQNPTQQETGDSSPDLSLFLTVLKDMENGEAIEKTGLLKQTLDLIKKLPIEEKQKWLEAIEITNFQGINQGQPLKNLIRNFSEDFPEHKIVEDLKYTVELGTSRNQTSLTTANDEQSDLVYRASIEKKGSQPPPVKIEINHQPPMEEKSFLSPVISKENQAPIRNAAEPRQASKTTEMLANQQMHQPEKPNEINIKSIEPPSVIPVSQFVPEVSKWIGEFVKDIPIPEQSRLTEAKISLKPEHFGPIQIKITSENRIVTVHIFTETNSGKEALDNQLSNLKQTLQQQGVLVEKIEVSHQPPVEEQSFVTPVISKENPAPIRNAVEPKPTFQASEILANQQMQQPEKTNELNIKSKEPPSVISVSQFVPEVSKWIGELVKSIPKQQSSLTEAKISLKPDQFGTIQIKISNDNGKVTAKIVTDTIFAKDTLEVQLPQLRQALQQQGILVQKLEITHQPLLVKDLIQAINSPLSNQGFLSSIGAREKPVSTTKTLEKQNIMTSWGSKGKQVILQKTIEEQKIPTARGSGETQTSFPITVEEQITITTQEKRIDQIQWPKSEEVPMTSEERSNHARPQPPVEEQSNISTMPSVEQQTPLKKDIEEPRILAAINTKEDPISDSKLEIKSSNLITEENEEKPILVTNHSEDLPVFDSSEKIVIQQMQQPDKLIAAKPIAPPPVFPVSQFVPEVSKWIEGVIRTNPGQFGSTEAKFSLNPEKLGPIQIKITTEQGKVTAQIVTDTIFAKEALELQLPQLRQALQQQGILVQKLEIIQQNLQYVDFAQSNNSFSQAGSGFSQEQRANTTQQNGSKKQKNPNKEEIVKEMVFTTYGGRGPRSTQSNIDFTA